MKTNELLQLELFSEREQELKAERELRRITKACMQWLTEKDAQIIKGTIEEYNNIKIDAYITIK